MKHERQTETRPRIEMRRTGRFLVAGVLLALLAAAGVRAQDEPAATPAASDKVAAETGARVWTSSNGHEITAEFLEIKNGVVLLKDEDGATRNVRLSLLAPADQKLAQHLQEQKSAEPSAAVAQASSNRLPVFAEGPGKGFHAVYTSPNFVAQMRPDTRVDIQCMENGAPVGKPLRLSSYHAYREPKLNRTISRSIVSFDKVSEPTLTPGVLVFEGFLDDQVQFGFGVEFKGNTVQAWGWVEDPPGIERPTHYFHYFSIPAFRTFEAHVPVVEQKKALEPYWVSVKPVKGKTMEYPYGVVVKGWTSGVALVNVEGPAFGGRKLSFTPGHTKTGTLQPWIYPSFAPYQGYQVRLRKEEQKYRGDRCRIILTVN